MLFPTDPATRAGLMADTLRLLSSAPQILVIVDGQAQNEQAAELPSQNLAAQLCRQFELSSIRRVGSSHGAAIGPIWGLDSSKGVASVKLFVLPTSVGNYLRKDRLEEEVRIILIDLEFQEREVLELQFPMSLEGVECEGWKACETREGTGFRRV